MQGGHGARHEDSGSACATCTSGGGFEWSGRFSFGKYKNIVFILKQSFNQQCGSFDRSKKNF